MSKKTKHPDLMKGHTAYILIALFAFCAVSCEENDCCSDPEKRGDDVLGNWLLVERGGSVGSGYFILPVSPEPPQGIKLWRSGKLTCSVEGLTEYRFYSIRGDVIGFFRKDPGPEPDISSFTHSYNYTFEDGKLKLWYRYCVEGCHLGFERID